MVSPVKGVGIWLQIKTAYQNHEGTLHQLAERFGVTKKAVEMRCYREGWNREQKEISRMVKERVVDLATSEATRWVSDTVKRSFRYRSDIDATRSQSGSDAQGNALFEPTDIRTLAQAESVIDSMARRSLGLAERVDVTSGGKDIGSSFIEAIAAMRANESLPKLGEQDLQNVMDGEIIG